MMDILELRGPHVTTRKLLQEVRPEQSYELYIDMVIYFTFVH